MLYLVQRNIRVKPQQLSLPIPPWNLEAASLETYAFLMIFPDDFPPKDLLTGHENGA